MRYRSAADEEGEEEGKVMKERKDGKGEDRDEESEVKDIKSKRN